MQKYSVSNTSNVNKYNFFFFIINQENIVYHFNCFFEFLLMWQVLNEQDTFFNLVVQEMFQYGLYISFTYSKKVAEYPNYVKTSLFNILTFFCQIPVYVNVAPVYLEKISFKKAYLAISLNASQHLLHIIL